MIFVFGSNLAGRHGAGSAYHALIKYGAEYGVGIGRTGDAYAIPTKDHNIQTLPLKNIKVYVDGFIKYANDHPELKFQVTKIGCGLARLKEEDIKPMFKLAPENCNLPDNWRD